MLASLFAPASQRVLNDYFFKQRSRVTDQVSFLQALIPQRGCIVDAFCGSGVRARELAAEGYTVTGLEKDEVLLEQATSDNRIKVYSMAPGDITKIANPATVQAIVCMDNGLAHLRTEDDLEHVLSQFSEVLVENGVLTLQLDNYARILQRKVRNLPVMRATVSGQAVLLLRQYEFDSSESLTLHVNAIHEVGDEWVVHDMASKVQPFEHSILLTKLRQCGFTDIHMYANFQKEEFRPMDSDSLIMTALRMKRADNI